MTYNDMEAEEDAIRKEVSRRIPNDAVDVDTDGNETVISLFYHEPEAVTKPVSTPFGVAIAVMEPQMDALIAELVDDIYLETTPDDISIEDEGGFYVVELTYEDGSDV